MAHDSDWLRGQMPVSTLADHVPERSAASVRPSLKARDPCVTGARSGRVTSTSADPLAEVTELGDAVLRWLAPTASGRTP
jgi:hypothetical protein